MKKYCSEESSCCGSCSANKGYDMFDKFMFKVVPYFFKVLALGVVLYAALDQFYFLVKKDSEVVENKEFILKKDSLNLKRKFIDKIFE